MDQLELEFMARDRALSMAQADWHMNKIPEASVLDHAVAYRRFLLGMLAPSEAKVQAA